MPIPLADRPRFVGARGTPRRFGLVALLVCTASILAVPTCEAGDEGSRLFLVGDYAGAAPALRQELKAQPGSARLARELGISLLFAGDAPEAMTALQRSRELNPRNRAALYFLGCAAEAVGDGGLALEAYQACLALGGDWLAPVRARMAAVLLAKTRSEVALALAAESHRSMDSVPGNTVAVADFALAGSDSLRPLCRGLAFAVLTDLRQLPELRLCEPERWQALMSLLPDSSDLRPAGPLLVVDRGSAPRLGALLRARRFVQGTLRSLGPDRVSLGGSVIDALDGEVPVTPVEGRLSDVLALEKSFVLHVLDALGVHASVKVRRAVLALPTRDLAAFEAFSRGLDDEAMGIKSSAAAAYSEAFWLDPHYRLPGERFGFVSDTTGRGQLEQTLLREALATDLVSRPRNLLDPQQSSLDALGIGPAIGWLASPGAGMRIDDVTRLGTSRQLPDFPAPPKQAQTGARRR